LDIRVALILVGLSAAPAGYGAAAQSSARTPRPPQSASAPDPAAVEHQLLEAVQRAPDSFAARHRLAGFYLQQGKVPAAIPHLQRAQQIDPSQYAVGYDLAVALIELNRLDDARVQVRRLLKLKDVGEVHNLLGDLEERAGNLVAAAEAYQRASHMDPSEENLFDWGNSLLQLRAPAPAGEVFTAAIKRHPRSARLHVGLGISLYSRGEYKDAVQSFCDAVDLAPSDPRAYQFLGEVYGVAPELGGEISARLRKFVAADPKNPLAHFHYAMSLWKGGGQAPGSDDFREIERLLKRAAVLDPRMTMAIFELGVLLAEQQRNAEAIECLRRAIELQPSLAQAHYRLGQLYQRVGRHDLAEKELAVFRELKGKGEDK
jgi:tetratricopeptide (TPR) repeat protein